MPFNIELLSSNIPVKIQIVKKVITVYFNGGENIEESIKARDNWSHLMEHFIRNFPEHGSEIEVSLTSGVYHRKKEHTNTRETTIYHVHSQFLVEVTPELFSRYLNELYKQQSTHGKEYQFFSGRSEVDNIITTFTEYYKGYKESLMEAEYEQETQLTSEEQEEHTQDIYNAKREQSKNTLNVSSLLIAQLLAGRHPLLNPPQIISNDELDNSDELDDDVNGCTLM